MPRNLDLVLLDGFFASSLAVTIDTLATANLVATTLGHGALFRWRTLSADGGAVEASAGWSMRADASLASPPRGDLSLVFGVGMADVPRITAALDRPDTIRTVEWLRASRAGGGTLAASCSSTFLVAETGALDDQDAATCWWLAPLFRARYPRVRLRPDAMVTVGRGVMCAGAAMAQVDLVLRIVALHAGEELAATVARYLAFDDGRATQRGYVVAEHLARVDPVVATATAWIVEHLATPFTVAQVARHAAVSERTLARRVSEATGLSVTALVQRLRVERAAALLRGGDRSVDEAARAVGYTDGATLRRLFRRELGRSPGEIRARGRTESASEPTHSATSLAAEGPGR